MNLEKQNQTYPGQITQEKAHEHDFSVDNLKRKRNQPGFKSKTKVVIKLEDPFAEEDNEARNYLLERNESEELISIYYHYYRNQAKA